MNGNKSPSTTTNANLQSGSPSQQTVNEFLRSLVKMEEDAEQAARGCPPTMMEFRGEQGAGEFLGDFWGVLFVIIIYLFYL